MTRACRTNAATTTMIGTTKMIGTAISDTFAILM